MKQVLFIGDINVDIILGGLESFPVVDREVNCESYELTLGSSAVICACNYAALGGKAWFLGLAGRDAYGEFMVRGMSEFGVNTEFVRWTNRVKTGVTVNLIYQSTRTQVTYPGTIAELEATDVGESLIKRFDHIHFAGPYQQTKFRGDITRLLELAEKMGVSTSLDPQWDPRQRWDFMDEWLPLLSYFLPNEDEALSITRKSSIAEACETLALRTSCPVVKMGKEGAYISSEGRLMRVPAVSVEVVDTTGAGDAFDAAFLFSILEKNERLVEAVRFANAAAARSCLFRGGVNARSTYDQILDFMGG